MLVSVIVAMALTRYVGVCIAEAKKDRLNRSPLADASRAPISQSYFSHRNAELQQLQPVLPRLGLSTYALITTLLVLLGV